MIAKPDRAGAEHCDRVVDIHAQRVDDSAGAGHDATAQRSEQFKRSVFRHLHHTPLADHGMRGERGLPLIIMDDLFAFRQRTSPVDTAAEEIPFVKFVTVDRKTGVAARAMAAECRSDYHRIARCEPRDAGADLLDDTRAFMTEHHRVRHRIDEMIAHRHVGVTDSRRDHSHQNFVSSRLAQRDFFQNERFFFRERYGGSDLHEPVPWKCSDRRIVGKSASFCRSQMARRPHGK